VDLVREGRRVTYALIGDEFGPESYGLSAIARILHVDALSWNNHMMRDYLIPRRELAKLNYTEESQDAQVLGDAIAELIAAGFWEDRGQDLYIGCKDSAQPSRAQLMHLRAKNAERQRRKRAHTYGDHSLCLPSNCSAARNQPLSITADPSQAEPNQGNAVTNGVSHGVTGDPPSFDESRWGDE
jgi:hypothetical protein